MRTLILAASMLMSAAAPAAAQTATGDWRGTLTPVPGTSLRLAVHILAAQEGGGLVGTLDSLDQGASGIALAAIGQSGTRLSFAVPAVGASFQGTWAPATGSWVGTFTQGPMAMALTLVPDPAVAAGPLAVPARWEMPGADTARLLDALAANRPGVKAAAALVDKGRTSIRTSAQGDPAVLYELGSITKLFTALLLADMVAKGEVKLDDPVANYLPAGTLGAPRHRAITLRDLASHYSGLPRLPANLAPADMADPYAGYDEAAMLAFLKSWSPSRAPGAMFEYSNYGAGLLGYALGRAAGTPYEMLLTERILKPLGMSATRFAHGAGEATPHGPDGKPVKAWTLGALSAAGGLRSTAGDMAKFVRALVRPRGKLAPAIGMLLRDRKPGGDPAKIGLGLFARPTTAGEIAFHDGGTGGSQSSLILDIDRQRGAVVLINAAGRPAPGPLAVHLVTGRPLPTR